MSRRHTFCYGKNSHCRHAHGKTATKGKPSILRHSSLGRRAVAVLACLGILAVPAGAASLCQDEQATPQVPTDLALCARLDPIVRKPSALPLDQYETALNQYVSAMCHRNFAAGWQMDKTVRDTGPFIATLANGQWSGEDFGTHAPVLVWYSPEMMAWLLANRPSDPAQTPARIAPVPDGAILVKEMYSRPRPRPVAFPIFLSCARIRKAWR